MSGDCLNCHRLPPREFRLLARSANGLNYKKFKKKVRRGFGEAQKKDQKKNKREKEKRRRGKEGKKEDKNRREEEKKRERRAKE
ncbi:hypothetical protein C4D60_Mb08t11600 [Musa balbisiana]|uniref:Uncharacterized protein n=1 Tax=Musa balbisiana TaxID=52838 RepID=A0A4S8K315_MUSBA|nr:hypothetical protein C4D60_Mb08t11600 [Musa balbisiana]